MKKFKISLRLFLCPRFLKGYKYTIKSQPESIKNWNFFLVLSDIATPMYPMILFCISLAFLTFFQSYNLCPSGSSWYALNNQTTPYKIGVSKSAKKNLKIYEFNMRIMRAPTVVTLSPRLLVRYKIESIAVLSTSWLTIVDPLFLSHKYFPDVSFFQKWYNRTSTDWATR